jgi:hypothetical protein
MLFHMFEIPSEIVGLIAHELVSAAGVQEVWKALGICGEPHPRTLQFLINSSDESAC